MYDVHPDMQAEIAKVSAKSEEPIVCSNIWPQVFPSLQKQWELDRGVQNLNMKIVLHHLSLPRSGLLSTAMWRATEDLVMDGS